MTRESKWYAKMRSLLALQPWSDTQIAQKYLLGSFKSTLNIYINIIICKYIVRQRLAWTFAFDDVEIRQLDIWDNSRSRRYCLTWLLWPSSPPTGPVSLIEGMAPPHRPKPDGERYIHISVVMETDSIWINRTWIFPQLMLIILYPFVLSWISTTIFLPSSPNIKCTNVATVLSLHFSCLLCQIKISLNILGMFFFC